MGWQTRRKLQKAKTKPKKLLPLFNGLLMRRFSWIYWPGRWPFSLPVLPPTLPGHSQMEMQNVKFEKRAKRLKLIRLGVFGTGCPGSPGSHFSKHTDGQRTGDRHQFTLCAFRFPVPALRDVDIDAIVVAHQNVKSYQKMKEKHLKVGIETDDDFYLNDSTDWP